MLLLTGTTVAVMRDLCMSKFIPIARVLLNLYAFFFNHQTHFFIWRFFSGDTDIPPTIRSQVKLMLESAWTEWGSAAKLCSDKNLYVIPSALCAGFWYSRIDFNFFKFLS